MKYSVFVALALSTAAAARPTRFVTKRLDAATNLQNGQDAIALNNKFQTLAAGSACSAGDLGCVGDQFAQCVNGAFLAQACAPGTQCAALPLVNAAGTTIACTTASDLQQRIAATGATDAGSSTAASSSVAAVASTTAAAAAATSSTAAASGTDNSSTGTATGTTGNATANNSDPQNSLTLDPAVISTGFQQNGQAVQEAGQVPSLVSNNNFINFCLTVPNLPLTNGQQVTTGSCNPAPIGSIPATTNMPASKFSFPTNGGTVPANANFTIQLGIARMETGNFVNAQTNYFAAPQQLNAQGQIIGHTHVVIEALSDLADTTVPNPTTFAFFKGINTAAANGIVTATVSPGLAAGAYRVCSINAAANHQPVILPVAQHGNSDDCVYFTAQ